MNHERRIRPAATGRSPDRKIRPALLLSALLLAGCRAEPELANDEEVCSPPRAIAELPDDVRDASGVAISRAHAGVLWMHNNSERIARIFAVDSTARIRATLTVPDARNIDWEDIAVASCEAGHCLYIAEIGDNLHERDDVGFYRLPEPEPSQRRTAVPEWFPFSYPTGPQDAEALFVLPDEQVFIISKGRNRSITLYRYPAPLRPGERVQLELLQELSDGIVQLPEQVTGADATADGRVIVVRTYSRAQLYRFDNEQLHPLLEPPGIDLRPLDEPQGEGIAISDRGHIVLNGERGVNARRAPLGVLSCRLEALDRAPPADPGGSPTATDPGT